MRCSAGRCLLSREGRTGPVCHHIQLCHGIRNQHHDIGEDPSFPSDQLSSTQTLETGCDLGKGRKLIMTLKSKYVGLSTQKKLRDYLRIYPRPPAPTPLVPKKWGYFGFCEKLLQMIP